MVNVQTPAFQQRTQALQQLAANVSNGGATSSGVTAPSNNMPSQSVGQYRNQQLGGLTTGLSGTTTPNGVAPPGSTLANAVPGSVEDMANQAIQNVQNSSQTQLGLSQAIGDRLRAQQQQRQAQAAAAAQAATAAAAGQRAVSQNYRGTGYGSNKPVNYSNNKNLSAARNQALSTAFSYVGDPYVLGGTSHRGIDCSGLVMAVYDQFGYGRYVDNHNATTQGRIIPGVRTNVSNLQPGDIVAWTNGSHIAIYAGNGMIVAAAAPGEGVKYQPVWGSVFGIHLTLPGE